MNLSMYSIRIFDLLNADQGCWWFGWKLACECSLSTCMWSQKLVFLGAAVCSRYNYDLDEIWRWTNLVNMHMYECLERLWLTKTKSVWIVWAVLAYISSHRTYVRTYVRTSTLTARNNTVSTPLERCTNSWNILIYKVFSIVKFNRVWPFDESINQLRVIYSV